jgi:MFS family permease
LVSLSGALRGSALADRRFRLLFGARTISSLGNSFTAVALAFAVLDISGSTADLGLVLAARSIPLVVLLVFGGVWADRLSRHRVMQVANAVCAASQGAIAVLLVTGHADVGELAALGAVGGAAEAFFFPASVGLIPEVVDKEKLQSANGIMATSLNLSQIVGAALAGLLVAAAGPGWAIGIDALGYGVAAALLAALHLPTRPPRDRTSMLSELRDGWAEFSGRTWVWVIVLQFAAVNAVFDGSLLVLGPVVARMHLGGPRSWGLVLSAQAIGSVLGGLAALRMHVRRPILVAELGTLAVLPVLGLLAVPTHLVWICVAALVAGGGIGVFGVLWETTLQRNVPGEALSRVSSYDAIGSFALIPLGLAVAGPVAALIGVRATLLGSFGVGLAVTLLAMAVPAVRGTEAALAAPVRTTQMR